MIIRDLCKFKEATAVLKRCFFSTPMRKAGKFPEINKTLSKFSFPKGTHVIRDINPRLQEILDREERFEVTLNGHIHRKPRVMSTRSFAEFRDENGDIVQIVVSPNEASEEIFGLIKNSGAEDAVSVSGYVQGKKPRKNEKSRTWELVVQRYQVLNHAGLDAARLDSLKHESPENLPTQFRYLQLRMPFYQNSLKTRSRAANLIRRTLEDHDFSEIETPLLFKSTPEGAREFLVPLRYPGKFYALPQSPQQYKQILMSSGFHRYFQIAKCFRDEDLRADRQPEFTQVDLEMAFVSRVQQVCVIVENLIHKVWNRVGGKLTFKVNQQGHLERIPYDGQSCGLPQFSFLTYQESLSRYGIDKPDLRYDLQIMDLSDFFVPIKTPENFPVVEACILRNAIDLNQNFEVPSTLRDENNYSRRNPFVMAVRDMVDSSSWYESLLASKTFEMKHDFDKVKLNSLMQLNPGDIVAISTRGNPLYENPTPLGRFRQLAIAEYPYKWKRKLVDENTGDLTENYPSNNIVVGSWVVDFPLFCPSETGDKNSEYPSYDLSKLESTHHPFTMAKLEDYHKLETSPLDVRGEHYDLVINGVEVGGGSRRIHDTDLQRFVFEDILKIQNYRDLFDHLLHALSMGCPPHAGIALGFDRLCAMLVDSNNIRDVIAFPKSQSGADPVVNSPSSVSKDALKEYYIETTTE